MSPLLLATIIAAAALTPAKAQAAEMPMRSPADKLLVVSFDAFKPDYLLRGLTPNLQALIDGGVRADYMRSTFPTKTFPNHFSIATGLHAGVHGVLGSKVHDNRRNETWKYQYEMFHQHDWVRPLWTVNEQLGGHSGCMMWPGGEFDYGDQPIAYVTAYNHDSEWNVKVDTAISWLSDPNHSANLVFLYFDEPDYDAHVYSPNSPRTAAKIQQTDRTVAYIQQKLRDYALLDRTNVVYLSDHGMSSVRSPQFLNLSALLPADSVDMYGGSPVLQIVPRSWQLFSQVLSLLQVAAGAKDSHFRVYTVDSLPERWHLSNPLDNDRVGPIVAVADEGWAFEDMFETAKYYEDRFNVTRSPLAEYGIHGYDNREPEMRAFFVASGPAFEGVRGEWVRPFDNVELYGLFWRLLGWPQELMPATNGTEAAERVWEDLVGRGRSGGDPNRTPLGAKHIVLLVLLLLAVLIGLAARLLWGMAANRRRCEKRDKVLLL